MRQRIASIVRKEFIQIRRDRRTLAMVLLMPLFQLLIFGYAIATDVRNVSTAIWDSSRTPESRALISSFEQSGYFTIRYLAESYADMTRLIDSGRAKVGLVIPADYATQLQRNETATVQLLLDGSDPSISIQTLAGANLIAQAKTIEIVGERFGSRGLQLPLELRPRVWYNPDMESVIFNVPGLVGIILQMLTTLLTAFAIVRERELGTMEQLIVTPIRPLELIIGKLLPYIAIAYADVILVLATAMLFFGMPMRGSLPLLLALCSVFLMFSLGIGLLISTVSSSQFQAMQMSFMTLLPTILLSGFIFPIEAMPIGAQWLSAVVPLTYFLRIVRGIVLKGVGIEYLWTDVAVLAAIGSITLLASAARLRQRLG